MKNRWLYLIKISTLHILILINGCFALQPGRSDYELVYKLAKEKFIADYEILPNDLGTFILCSKVNKKEDHLHFYTEYFVFDVNKKEIIFEEKVIDSQVYWLDRENLEIIYTSEIIYGDENLLKFVLNLHTKEKRKLNY